MCYSAQILADYRRYVRMFGAHMDIAEFARLYFLQAEGSGAKTPKALDDAFRDPQNDGEREIWQLIDKTRAQQKTKLEQELFKQRTRLTDAERKLESKVTKAATESRRIATDKIDAALHRIEDSLTTSRNSEPAGYCWRMDRLHSTLSFGSTPWPGSGLTRKSADEGSP